MTMAPAPAAAVAAAPSGAAPTAAHGGSWRSGSDIVHQPHAPSILEAAAGRFPTGHRGAGPALQRPSEVGRRPDEARRSRASRTAGCNGRSAASAGPLSAR